jgi:hypothetical protein
MNQWNVPQQILCRLTNHAHSLRERPAAGSSFIEILSGFGGLLKPHVWIDCTHRGCGPDTSPEFEDCRRVPWPLLIIDANQSMAFAAEPVENVVLGGVIGLPSYLASTAWRFFKSAGVKGTAAPNADSKDVVAAQLGWLELCNSAKRDRVVRPYRPLSNACSKASASGPVSQQVIGQTMRKRPARKKGHSRRLPAAKY